MTVSRKEVERMKMELDKYEKKLLKHENKWNAASVVQRLSIHDQSRLLKASVAARTSTVTLIPKLKFKIDTWQTKKDDRLLEEILAEFETINTKAQWAFEEFKKLESGRDKGSRAPKNERDKALSKSIEQSLAQRREKKHATNPGISLSEMANTRHKPRSSKTDEDVINTFKSKPSCSLANKGVKEQFRGGGDVKDLVTKEDEIMLNADEETKTFMRQLQETLSPEELAWVMKSKQGLAGLRKMKNLVEKLDYEDGGALKHQIEKTVMMGVEDQHFRASTSTMRDTKNGEKMVGLKAKVPSPVPIDTFLNFVESLPGEIKAMVKEQTDSLCSLQEQQIFSKNRLSDHRDKVIDEDHLKWIKEQKVDDAVERYFGSFKKARPKLKGNVLDAILEDDYKERLPISDPVVSEDDEDPEELLEKYNLQRVNLLQHQDFHDNN
ncbi:hypothetical protein GE061_002863 [Apolygus lucorum]|uniref:Uncharacterized protein n=1 Tax=Apolygus lucorum TaxID=248454 RepID=A0A8S9X859_APOLU|nr:hypothetical protein GE061_002863 [Apolygus lucorum]